MVNLVTALPFARGEANAGAKIRVELERRGNPTRPFDTLIAGTAQARGGILVTHNINEFKRIQGLNL